MALEPPKVGSLPELEASEPTAAPAGPNAAPLAPEDFYYEGPYLVFTAAYHLKRGSCCHSGCRHCPYEDAD